MSQGELLGFDATFWLVMVWVAISIVLCVWYLNRRG